MGGYHNTGLCSKYAGHVELLCPRFLLPGPGIKSGACCTARGLISGTGGGAGADGAALDPSYN